MALVYAALDRSQDIRFEHFHAATAVEDYAEKSTELIFDDSTGNDIADSVRGWLRLAAQAGMSRTEIVRKNNNRTDGLDDALDLLKDEQIAYCVKLKSNSGPASERWFVAPDQPVVGAMPAAPDVNSTGVLSPKCATSATSGKTP